MGSAIEDAPLLPTKSQFFGDRCLTGDHTENRIQRLKILLPLLRLRLLLLVFEADPDPAGPLEHGF